jgi:hypothetical protein
MTKDKPDAARRTRGAPRGGGTGEADRTMQIYGPNGPNRSQQVYLRKLVAKLRAAGMSCWISS